MHLHRLKGRSSSDRPQAAAAAPGTCQPHPRFAGCRRHRCRARADARGRACGGGRRTPSGQRRCRAEPGGRLPVPGSGVCQACARRGQFPADWACFFAGVGCWVGSRGSEGCGRQQGAESCRLRVADRTLTRPSLHPSPLPPPQALKMPARLHEAGLVGQVHTVLAKLAEEGGRDAKAAAAGGGGGWPAGGCGGGSCWGVGRVRGGRAAAQSLSRQPGSQVCCTQSQGSWLACPGRLPDVAVASPLSPHPTPPRFAPPHCVPASVVSEFDKAVGAKDGGGADGREEQHARLLAAPDADPRRKLKRVPLQAGGAGGGCLHSAVLQRTQVLL